MKSPAQSVVVTVAPSPATVGSDVQITASGITTQEYLNVVVMDAEATAAYPVGPAVDGQVNATHHPFHAGTSQVEIRTVPEHGQQKVIGTASFDVT